MYDRDRYFTKIDYSQPVLPPALSPEDRDWVATAIKMIWLRKSVKGVGKMPTVDQLKTYFDRTGDLTKMYVPINLGTLDRRTGNVVILAGQEVVIEIYPNGRWRFLNE